MMGFSIVATLIDGRTALPRPFTATFTTPARLADGRYECSVTCSEPEFSRRVISAYSELAYNRALNRMRYGLIEHGHGLYDACERATWFDPPLVYPDRHRGFSGPLRGRWRPCMPTVSFVGHLHEKIGGGASPFSIRGVSPFSIRIGSPRRVGGRWRARFSASLFYTGNPGRMRFFGDWPDEAYSYAFRAVRREVDFRGAFLDDEGRPITITAPVGHAGALSC